MEKNYSNLLMITVMTIIITTRITYRNYKVVQTYKFVNLRPEHFRLLEGGTDSRPPTHIAKGEYLSQK